MVVGKRQAFRIGLYVAYIAADTHVCQAFAPVFQHRGIDVRQDDFTLVTHDACKFRGQIAGAACKIKHPAAAFRTRSVNCVTFPQAMDAE